MEKSCEKNRLKVFARITELLGEMNEKISSFCVNSAFVKNMLLSI